jgi:hypothetical protein
MVNGSEPKHIITLIAKITIRSDNEIMTRSLIHFILLFIIYLIIRKIMNAISIRYIPDALQMLL